MNGEEFYGDGTLRLAFATWVYLLHVSGVDPADEGLAAQCAALDAAEDREVGDAAGLALVRRVSELVGDRVDPDAVKALADGVYPDRVGNDLGDGARSERTARIRKYQFGRNLPWLARIYERQEGGEVAPTWLLVNRVTDQVRALDFNPWNEVDEDRNLPVLDFQVLWELDGCTSLHIR